MQELINNLLNTIGETFTVNGKSVTDPTLTLSQGQKVRVFISKDIVVNPYALIHDTFYVIQVSPKMTSKEGPLRFNIIWNKGNPIPLSIMICKILDSTRGMYLVEAYGAPFSIDTCMLCGRKLENPLSMLYGIGPECSHKVNLKRPFKSEQELSENLAELEKNMKNIKWRGWIIKSEIIGCEEYLE